MTEVSGRADVEATRTRFVAANDQKTRVLVSTGSTVPGHEERGIRHAGRLTRLQAGAAHVKQGQHPPQRLVQRGAP
jgi:hypothetical protein